MDGAGDLGGPLGRATGGEEAESQWLSHVSFMYIHMVILTLPAERLLNTIRAFLAAHKSPFFCNK